MPPSGLRYRSKLLTHENLTNFGRAPRRRRRPAAPYSGADLLKSLPPRAPIRKRCAGRQAVGQMAQNWNGATETDILPSDDCWTVKLTSFEAFVSPTVTDNGAAAFQCSLILT